MIKSLRRVSWAPVRVALVIVSALFWPLWASAQATKTTRQVPVESLIYDLKNPDPVRRKEAARLLGENKVQKATPDLVAAAQDPDLEVRREIVIALDKMLDIRVLPAFVKLSADQDKLIRDRCIVGLTNLYIPQEGGLVVTLNKIANFFNPWSDEWADVVVEPGIKVDGSAITALCERLSDTDDGIRLRAARGLGILKGKAAVPVLLTALRQDQTNAVRFEIIRSLGKIGDGSAAPDFMNYLGYNDTKVRNEAIFVIGRFRYHEAMPEMMRLYEKESALPPKLIDKPFREALLDAMAFIADPSAKPLFAKEKQNPEGALRLHAIEGLARLGDPAMATEISRDWLHEKDAQTKTAEAYALFRMGRREYLDEVVNCLGNGKTNSEARMFLLELKLEELPELYAQANNKDVNVREGLAEILGLVGDERAIPVLLELSKDRRGQITAIANQAVRRINARIARQ
jgi:HEAT repeat protein